MIDKDGAGAMERKKQEATSDDVHQSTRAFGYEAFLRRPQRKEVLRFITCGSVVTASRP